MAVFVATLANVAGSGPKKAINPGDLFEPQLSHSPKSKPTARDVAETKRDLKDEIARLAAMSPPPR